MYALESQINRELVDLKDLCWQNSHLIAERVEIYFFRVHEYKTQGYNVRVHELITELFYEKLNKNSQKVLQQNQKNYSK